MKADYVPGRRNIGPNEVRRRRRIGIVGAAASILLFLLLLWMDAPRPMRVLLALPILTAVLGFVQATCDTWVVMGMRGMHRMNGTTFPVATRKEREADRQRSLRLWLRIGFLTLALTALTLITPFP